MSEVNLRVQSIFDHAASLQQNGRLRNTIYCYKKFIYILNQDFTVFLRFPLRDTEVSFSHPVSFNANDYESKQFREEDGKIIFITEGEDYVRTKSCKTPQFSPKEIHKLFVGKKKEEFKRKGEIVLKDTLLAKTDDDLSHMEFSVEKGELVIRQRNIYSGSVISIRKNAQKSNLLESSSKLKNFKPIGLRTNDFMALFIFTKTLHFYFNNRDTVWVESKDKKMPFIGIISQCVYDELGG